jgi:ribosomal protein S18 acetylase RimI-like enzyme
MPTHADIEAIERATLAAVAPPAVEELGGWLLPYDNGTVGRAKSAVPLYHDVPRLAVIALMEARYAARGLPTMLRIPGVPAFDAFRAELRARGYGESKPTLVQVAALSPSADADADPAVQVSDYADDEWAAVFLGEGFDPVDGASRVQTLRRAHGSLFASIREEGRVVAAGVLALGQGWASVHGMRTALTHRRLGLAWRVFTTLQGIAVRKGYDNMMLQVEAGNTQAQQLYARRGFSTAWPYSYWER